MSVHSLGYAPQGAGAREGKMTKLAEGMTRSRTEWGSTIHHYKGVRIRKSGSGYEVPTEAFVWQSSKFFASDKYISWQLNRVPAEIDKMLADGKYYVTDNGALFLNPDFKEQIINDQIEHATKEIADLHNKVTSLLANGAYTAVEQGAKSLSNLQTKLNALRATLETIQS